jgi:hypothetical protein
MALIDLSTLLFVTEVTTVLQIKGGTKIRIVQLRQKHIPLALAAQN